MLATEIDVIAVKFVGSVRVAERPCSFQELEVPTDISRLQNLENVYKARMTMKLILDAQSHAQL